MSLISPPPPPPPQEALKLQQDMRKKKQEMLETQIECQKVRRLTLNLFLSVLLPLFFPPVFCQLSSLILFVFPFQALISRLEKNRSMKPEERANIMKTLKELTEKITQLQNEMNPASQASSGKANHTQPKTKTDVSLAYESRWAGEPENSVSIF